MKLNIVRIIVICLASTMATLSLAENYTPDVYELNGKNMLEFDPSALFEMASGGTVEFWVAADWKQPPAYDPSILVNAGPEGAHYLVAMLRDRSGLAIASGDSEDVAQFDFSDGRLHHVAIRFFPGAGFDAMIDGRFVASSELNVAMKPSAGFWIGSIDGEGHPFIGAIAGLRLWGRALDQQTLVDFAMRDIFAAEHPDLDSLLAVSDFANGELLLAE